MQLLEMKEEKRLFIKEIFGPLQRCHRSFTSNKKPTKGFKNNFLPFRPDQFNYLFNGAGRSIFYNKANLKKLFVSSLRSGDSFSDSNRFCSCLNSYNFMLNMASTPFAFVLSAFYLNLNYFDLNQDTCIIFFILVTNIEL